MRRCASWPPPSLRPPFRQYAGDVDEGIEAAQQRLEETLEELRSGGIDASGAVGDSEPDRAIEDALRDFPADEIVLVTHPDDEARWLESEAFERASGYFEPPVTRLVVERDGDEERVADVERAPAGRQDRPEEEPSARSRNLPPMTKQDLLGIAVAVVGTIVLIVLASVCAEGAGLEHDVWGLDGCDWRLLIAGFFGLINIAHVTALILFQSVRYRGFWESFFARLALFGTPAAIVVSALIV